MDEYDTDLDNEVNDIISQIKNQGKKINLQNVEKDYPELTPDQVDAFVLKYASRVIIDLAQAVQDQAEVVKDAGTSSDVVALSELARAFQGNVEILQKRKIADNKNVSQKEIKQMDIDSKSSQLLLGDSDTSSNGNFTASREEMLKAVARAILEKPVEPTMEETPVIDV